MENNQAQGHIPARSKEQIQEIIEQWQQSGKSKKKFCQENNLVYMTFIGWTAPRKSGKLSVAKKKSTGFIPLRINKTAAGIFAELNLRGGSKVVFHSPVSAQYLKEILG